jgi:uncharacterized protein involved in cysteine biosynthesis
MSQLVRPKILKVAAYVLVAFAFYFGLQAHANLLYVIPYSVCAWIAVLAYFEYARLEHERLKFEHQKLLVHGLDPKERDRLIVPPE